MARITRKLADQSARRLNEILGLPTECYRKNEQTGRYDSQIGCIHICSQNGTNNIYQMFNEAGGCKALAVGLTVRECNDWLNAAMAGIMLDRSAASTLH